MNGWLKKWGYLMIEKEILGCILKDNSLINETIIRTNQFSNEHYRLLFQSMQKLSFENKAIDKVTLMSDNYEYISQLGGPSFITDIETVGNVENFETYEREFIDKYLKRESESITKSWLSKQERDTQTLINDLQNLDDLSFSDEQNKNEVLKSMFDLPYSENAIDIGVRSGLNALDTYIGGFQNQQSYIMGARPSMGKTATMLTFALGAIEKGAVPLIFSLEMSKESLLRRMISTVGTINSFTTRTPYKLNESKKKSWQESINKLHSMDFEIYDKPSQSIQYIRSQVRKARRKHEGKQVIVLIDYLTLIQNSGDFYSDHAKYSDISKRLKMMAKEHDCPVVTLAQLSRGLEQRQDKRPMLSDLRESGSIEEDADCVMFLYRDSYYNKNAENDNLEINVAKHRDGPTGTATVYYNKATGKMGDLSAY